MADHILENRIESGIQANVCQETVYPEDINYDPESNDSIDLAQLNPLIEYVYDDDQSERTEFTQEEYSQNLDIGDHDLCQDDFTVEHKDVIEPMMPFYLTSSTGFNVMNEDDDLWETIILQVDNDEESKKPQRTPIPDEVRASTLQILLCSSKTNSVVDTYTCEVCSVSYGCLNCLKSHYETMHLGNTVISRYKCKHALSLNKGLYCPVCELTFDTRSDTMDHYITHAVACDDCGCGFDRQMYLSEHLRTVHHQGSCDEVYECQLCKVTYHYGNTLSKHYQNFHKLILCVDCHMKFESVDKLQEHETTHRPKADILPFACSKCDKAFEKISDIGVHIRQDHDPKRKPVAAEFESLYTIKTKTRLLKSARKKIKKENLEY